MTNRETLENAGLIDPGAELSTEAVEALESLTADEVAALISLNNKLPENYTASDLGIIWSHSPRESS